MKINCSIVDVTIVFCCIGIIFEPSVMTLLSKKKTKYREKPSEHNLYLFLTDCTNVGRSKLEKIDVLAPLYGLSSKLGNYCTLKPMVLQQASNEQNPERNNFHP